MMMDVISLDISLRYVIHSDLADLVIMLHLLKNSWLL